MAFTIAASIGTAAVAPTGRPSQGHLQYAVNQGAYWVFYLSSTQALSALYSSNSGSSWSTPTGSPFTLNKAHNSEGRNFGFCYGNISSTDVLFMGSAYYLSTTNFYYDFSRFTLGTTWTNTNAETQNGTGAANASTSTAGLAGCFTSTNKPAFGNCYGGSAGLGNDEGNVATNADTGSSWTTGWGTSLISSNGVSNMGSTAMCSLGSGNVLGICDNAASNSTFTQLNYSKYTGTWAASATVLASTVTTADMNAYGVQAVTTSDVHVVALSNNSNAYVHRRFNGTSWSNSSGAPGTLAYGTNSGISLVTDGTSVWAACIDTSKNIKYNKWTSGGGWGGWTTLEAARTNTPSYITGVYNPTGNEIMWMWTELNGTNHDIIGSVLSLAGAPSVGVDSWFVIDPVPTLWRPLIVQAY